MLMGEQTPRLQVIPDGGFANAADDAIAVYELASQILDPWQEACIRNVCWLTRDLTWAAMDNVIIAQRQNGKGAPVEAICLASLFVWGNPVTVYSAHRLDTTRALFKRIRTLIINTPELARRCKPIAASADEIELLSGPVLNFRTRMAKGGRGLTGDVLIVDEALFIGDDSIASILPILLARPNVMVIYTSTVPADDEAHLCTMRERALGGDSGISWIEWGCDQEDRSDDPAALARGNPALGRRITLDRLHKMRKSLGEEKFRRECMGIWPKSSNSVVLDRKIWPKMEDLQSRRAPDSDVFLSIDIEPSRTSACIVMWAMREDGLEHVQLTDYERGTAWLLPRIAELQEALSPALWVIDKANGAYALRDDLKALGITEPVRLKGAQVPRSGDSLAQVELHRGALLVLDSDQAADAVAKFIDAYRAERLRHVGQEQLTAAVFNARSRPIGDSGRIGWGRRISTINIGPVVGAGQARYAGKVWDGRQARQKPRSRVY